MEMPTIVFEVITLQMVRYRRKGAGVLWALSSVEDLLPVTPSASAVSWRRSEGN